MSITLLVSTCTLSRAWAYGEQGTREEHEEYSQRESRSVALEDFVGGQTFYGDGAWIALAVYLLLWIPSVIFKLVIDSLKGS